MLEGLTTTTEWVCAKPPVVRHRIAQALAAGTQTEPFAGLAAHRSEAMYDPLRRDLERTVSRVFEAVSAAAQSNT